MGTISNERVKSFNEDGFIIVKNNEIKKLKKQIQKDLKDIALKIIELKNIEKIDCIKELSFKELLKYCTDNEDDKELTSLFYDIYKSIPSVVSLVSNKFIIKLVEELGLKTIIIGTVPNIRIDRPNDNFFSTPWHQDSWYQIFAKLSVVVWIPVFELVPEMGGLDVVPKSHKNGLLPFNNYEGNEPYKYAHEVKNEEILKISSMKDDELLIFNQHLLHKSNFNESYYSRVSVQLRFLDLQSMSSIKSTYVAKLTQDVLNAQKFFLVKG